MPMCALRDSGVGDHGTTGIQSFLNDHVCGPVCRKLKLEDLVVDQDPPCSPVSSGFGSDHKLDEN